MPIALPSPLFVQVVVPLSVTKLPMKLPPTPSTPEPFQNVLKPDQRFLPAFTHDDAEKIDDMPVEPPATPPPPAIALPSVGSRLNPADWPPPKIAFRIGLMTASLAKYSIIA